MSEGRIDITHDFTIDLDVFLGGKDIGADGLAFVLHNDPRGTKAVGLGGGNLGAWGIQNGLAISSIPTTTAPRLETFLGTTRASLIRTGLDR